MNRYVLLGADPDGGGERFAIERKDGLLWLIDRRKNPNDFPEMTESFFARMFTGTRRATGGRDMFKEVHVTHRGAGLSRRIRPHLPGARDSSTAARMPSPSTKR